MAMTLSSSGCKPQDQPLPDQPLPTDFRSVRDILDGKVKLHTIISVIGVVKDFQVPVKTKGTDWKCTMWIYDKSTEKTKSTEETESTEEMSHCVAVSIFRPEDQMPKCHPLAGDVFVAFSVKVQTFGSGFSLVSNHATSIHFYSQDEIPKPPESAEKAVQPYEGQKGRLPGKSENLYVSWFYHNIDKTALPSVVEHQEQVLRSANVKEKFSLLQDVKETQFYDLVVRVAKDPYHGITTSLWVTDYTENKSFFDHKLNPSGLDDGVDGDPYGYTAKHRVPTANTWPGPFGKRCLQVTCYDSHAEFLRSDAGPKIGNWVKLRNVQVKYGKNGNNLEGYLRGDPKYVDRVGVEVLDTRNPDECSGDFQRLKAAVVRQRNYDREVTKQLKELAASQRGNGAKRKSGATLNSKQRRKLKRSRLEQEEKEQEENKARMVGLNDLIKCESEDQDPFPLSRVLEGTETKLRCGGDETPSAPLPFDNVKFRANVRVVDFCPRKLEDFATWRKQSEYGPLLLSDDDASSGAESDTNSDEGTLERFVGPKVWEWRFALELEEVDPKRNKKDKPPRVWALVNNIEAQQLTRMDAVE